MNNNPFDNSHAGALKQAEVLKQNNWPAPVQQPGQTADHYNTVVNQLNHLNKQSGK